MHTHVPNKLENFRPPFWSFLLAALFFVAAAYFALLSVGGFPFSGLISLLLGAFGLQQGLKGWKDRDALLDYRRRWQRHKASGEEQHRARRATPEDIEKSKDLSTTSGILLGAMATGRNALMDVLWKGQGSGSIIGPPGVGKSQGVASAIFRGLGTDLVCLDVAGEYYALCRDALVAMGYEIVVLTAVPDEVSSLLGMPITDAGVQIYSELSPGMKPNQISGAIGNAMNWLVLGEPDMDANARFFLRGSKLLGKFYSMEELLDGRMPTVPALRKRLCGGMGHLMERVEELEGSTAFGGALADTANTLSDIMRVAGPQFAGSFGLLEQKVEQADPFSDMGRHLSGSTFDPNVLKDDTKRTAVFLIPTLKMMETFSPITSTTLTYLIDTAAAAPGKGKVTVVIDEASSHYLPKLCDSLNYYRKQNLVVLMCWQDLMGQTEKTYGKSGSKQIMAASQFVVAMGVQEYETLEWLSRMCGTQTVRDVALNERVPGEGGFGNAHTSSHRGVRLLSPEDIRGLPDDELLLIAGNTPPAILKKVPWWTREAWRRVAGRNPYFDG